MMDIQFDIRICTHSVYVSRKSIYTLYIYTSRVWKLAPNQPRTEKVSHFLEEIVRPFPKSFEVPYYSKSFEVPY
jgi:hypothetical protein